MTAHVRFGSLADIEACLSERGHRRGRVGRPVLIAITGTAADWRRDFTEFAARISETGMLNQLSRYSISASRCFAPAATASLRTSELAESDRLVGGIGAPIAASRQTRLRESFRVYAMLHFLRRWNLIGEQMFL